MTTFVHELVSQAAHQTPQNAALTLKSSTLNYQALDELRLALASGLQGIGIQRHDRIGIYLHKTFETVTTIFSAGTVGAVFVPINPVLKAPQVQHIVNDCQVKVIVTNKGRLNTLKPIIANMPSVSHIIVIDETTETQSIGSVTVINWQHMMHSRHVLTSPTQTGSDIAAILYTSGSTGKPKGVVLSHSNIVLGAESVASYLNNTSSDNILAVLPLSFDYGLNQITSCFFAKAHCVLLDYLLPNDVLKTIQKHQITGLAAVPPLWAQLCKLQWPEGCGSSVRYFTNSGGALNSTHLAILRKNMHTAHPILMYGLTEAFRSTYLPASEIDNKPGSMGKAIPNAEVLVVRPDGSECDADEAGELVHKGPLVSLGYWNAPEKTAQRFKPAPGTPEGVVLNELAVWSGDAVKKDQDGYLYFVSRQDEMIKTSGYRVSPMEVEEVLYQHTSVLETAVIGATHPELGQGIIAIILVGDLATSEQTTQAIAKHCQRELANFMVPKQYILLDKFPHNANGKIDRNQLTQTYKNYFIG